MRQRFWVEMTSSVPPELGSRLAAAAGAVSAVPVVASKITTPSAIEAGSIAPEKVVVAVESGGNPSSPRR